MNMHKKLLIALLSVGVLCNAEEPAQETRKFKLSNWWALGASAGAAALSAAAFIGTNETIKKAGEACAYLAADVPVTSKRYGAFVADKIWLELQYQTLYGLALALGFLSIEALIYFIYSNYVKYQEEKEEDALYQKMKVLYE